jgi:thioredoxin-like negative regulator of GroEL
MPGTLTVGERIILHLAQYSKYLDSYDAPLDISQDGIAAALRISRAHAAIELKKLKETGEVVEKLVHIKRGKTKRKVYFLSSPGEERGRKIHLFAESEGIDVQPFLDLRKCKGPELWAALDDEQKTVLAQACVFRRPFARGALPETSVSLLPVDPEGMVDMPPDLRTYVPGQVAPELLRQYHSLAADHWLDQGDYRERLYHLLKANRSREAEMLLASKGPLHLGPPDRDLLDIVCLVSAATERYRGRVLHAQAEIARRAGDDQVALQKAGELSLSSSPRDRFEGLMVEALVRRSKGDMDGSLQRLQAARELTVAMDGDLECETAETLIQAGRLPEAKEVLDRLISQGAKDGEVLERVFYQLGTIALRSGDGSGAVRFYSKSRGAAREKENGELYLRLADAYGLMGMAEKAEEYAVRAKRLHVPRTRM